MILKSLREKKRKKNFRYNKKIMYTAISNMLVLSLNYYKKMNIDNI